MASYLFMLCIVVVLQCYPVLATDVRPQYCGAPRPALVPIDPPDYNYWPYFVELHRCGGSCFAVNPRVLTCTASTIDSVSKTVFDLATDGKTKVIQLVNHTSCNCSCVQNPGSCDERMEKWNPKTCSCVCKNPAGHPYPCPANFRWSQYLCKCVCDRPPQQCPLNKMWSKEACSCVCTFHALAKCAMEDKLLDKETCTCHGKPPDVAARGGNGVHRDVMIGCMVAELLLLLLVFDVFLYCRYGDGVVTSIQRRCCSRKRHDDVPLRKETTENC